MRNIQLSRNCHVNSLSAKFILTVILAGLQESIPVFHEKIVSKMDVCFIKNTFPLRSQSTFQKKKCTRSCEWRIRTCRCPFDAAVIIHKLFNTQCLQLLSVSCAFYFFISIIKSSFLQDQGKKGECTVCTWILLSVTMVIFTNQFGGDSTPHGLYVT